MKKPILERRVAVEMGIIEVGEMFASYMREGCDPEYDGTPLGDARAAEDERDEDPIHYSYEETPQERALVEYLRDSNWTPDNFPIVSREEFGLE